MADIQLLRDEQNRHAREESKIKARIALQRAADDYEKYGYTITVYVYNVEETTGG